jgi:hypothetical protein
MRIQYEDDDVADNICQTLPWDEPGLISIEYPVRTGAAPLGVG